MTKPTLDCLPKPAMSEYATGREYWKALMLWAIDVEPELPGEMPEEMWNALRGFAYLDDREGMVEAMRIVVRETKKTIRERVEGLWPQP